MTYGQVRDLTLQLINRYSVAGTQVAEHYNNQADYLARIPGLVNDAMMEIATTVRPIFAEYDLDANTGRSYGDGWVAFDMPNDFFRIAGGGVPRFRKRRYHRFSQFRWLGESTLLIREKALADELFVEYYRYPVQLPAQPDDETPLDNVPVTHSALAYYAAAQLMMQDDAFQYATLYNKYEDKLSKMIPAPYTEPVITEDVYSACEWGELY